MNILVKYPTRQRPELFLKVLSEYVNKAKDNSKIIYLISYDDDDETMTETVKQRAAALPANIQLKGGNSKSKIDACNRDINEFLFAWDIILLVSDDMHVQVEGWDQIIRDDMHNHFPDTDGCLWYDDCDQKRVCTLTCIGRHYYQRFNYIYHEDYKSFFSDNEFTDIAINMEKMIMINNRIIKHEHPAWSGNVKQDDLYSRNDQFWNHDKKVYDRRKKANFTI